MKQLLEKYIGIRVQINYKDPVKFAEALLVSADDQYFAVELAETKTKNAAALRMNFPYRRINYVVDTVDGPIATGDETKWQQTAEGMQQIRVGTKKTIWIEVDHLVVYKGSVSVGFSVPIPTA